MTSTAPTVSTPSSSTDQNREGFAAPHPGVASMPQWETGELPEAPVFRWRQIASFIGPAILLAASAIGGGEWLTGPVTTARYGPALFWLATLSIVGQVIYNIEISRYTLYTGEPIFTGKFRIMPGPWFWVIVYLLVDVGSFLPYLAANAAIPLGAMWLNRIPTQAEDGRLIMYLGVAIFWASFLPLLVGGKIYNTVKAIMTFKLFYVFGLLVFLAVCFSTADHWERILKGFVQFGNMPVVAAEDLNHDGKQDDDEAPHQARIDNVFVAWSEGRSLPPLDVALIGFLVTMAAISGNGGLTNVPLSNYTRDQGWGMGAHVGAIPSIIGGQEIRLSHVGQVFDVHEGTIPRWRRWLWHVKREQLFLWMPACFVGIALPSLLSMLFIKDGKNVDSYQAAGITADGVAAAIGEKFNPALGNVFWYLMLFCGFIVLGTAMASTADGVLRRWVDVFWTASPRLREWDTKDIGKLYFSVLCVYAVCGTVMLVFVDPSGLVVLTGVLYTLALGLSCMHVIVINTLLLPKAIRPSRFVRCGLFATGIFFLCCSMLSAAVMIIKQYPGSSADEFARMLLGPILT